MRRIASLRRPFISSRCCFSAVRSAVCIGFDSPLQIREDPADCCNTQPLGLGQVRVKVAAAAINFADILQCKGKYQEVRCPPFVPGAECSGEIMEVGQGAPLHLKIGDKVLCFGNGGAFSTETIVSGLSCIKIPSEYANRVSLQDGAALMVTYGTAHLALTSKGRMSQGDVVLVTAAAGGVGLACCELAALMVGESPLLWLYLSS